MCYLAQSVRNAGYGTVAARNGACVRLYGIPCILFIILLATLPGCSTYKSDGSLIRHHFGYVRVLTPQFEGEAESVRVLTIKTTGAWLDVDRRSTGNRDGSGFGIGYRSDHREMIPLDCRLVVHLSNQIQMEQFLARVNEMNIPKEGICVTAEN